MNTKFGGIPMAFYKIKITLKITSDFIIHGEFRVKRSRKEMFTN